VTALVVLLTVVVALLGLLVVSLLRSHAEILRRLHEIDPNGADEHGTAHSHGPTPLEMGVRPGVALPRENDTAAHDVAGTAPNGDEVALALVGAGARRCWPSCPAAASPASTSGTPSRATWRCPRACGWWS
jgi:hypothetical protein